MSSPVTGGFPPQTSADAVSTAPSLNKYPLDPSDPAAQLDPALADIPALPRVQVSEPFVPLPDSTEPATETPRSEFLTGTAPVSASDYAVGLLDQVREDSSLPDRGVRDRVFGVDNRVRVGNTTQWPYSSICRLQLSFPNGTKAFGSGVMVSPRHVLTAGHCVHDSRYGGWAKSITAIPGLNGSYKPFGEANSSRLLCFTAWTNNKNLDYDVALVTLDRDIGYASRWMAIYPEPSVTRLAARTSNYPGDKDGGAKTIQYQSEGPIESSTPNQVLFRFDTYPGASGGPIYSRDGTQEVFSVVSWENTQAVAEKNAWNGGCRLDLAKYRSLVDAIKGELGVGSYFSASPARVTKGTRITQRIARATPRTAIDLYWITPAGSRQGPMLLGITNGDGDLTASWDTSLATQYGSYRAWVRDRSSGKTSNEIAMLVNP